MIDWLDWVILRWASLTHLPSQKANRRCHVRSHKSLSMTWPLGWVKSAGEGLEVLVFDVQSDTYLRKIKMPWKFVRVDFLNLETLFANLVRKLRSTGTGKPSFESRDTFREFSEKAPKYR
jgi:hypothetical protein